MIGSISDWELFFRKAYEYVVSIHIHFIMVIGAVLTPSCKEPRAGRLHRGPRQLLPN